MIYIHVIEHDSRSLPWIARITGADPRYGYARKFVRPRKDWRGAERRSGTLRTVGIRSCFMLEVGWVCEVQTARNFYDKKSPRYFARVAEDSLVRVEEPDVMAWLRRAS